MSKRHRHLNLYIPEGLHQLILEKHNQQAADGVGLNKRIQSWLEDYFVLTELKHELKRLEN